MNFFEIIEGRKTRAQICFKAVNCVYNPLVLHYIGAVDLVDYPEFFLGFKQLKNMAVHMSLFATSDVSSEAEIVMRAILYCFTTSGITPSKNLVLELAESYYTDNIFISSDSISEMKNFNLYDFEVGAKRFFKEKFSI